jgi:hypothetical protein
MAEEAVGRRAIGYDKEGDAHYDIISAFIKSIRGSDPNASIYYLARMLEAGEDPRFIARRLVILASEDVGNADPSALPLAVAAFTATEKIGMPECALNLSQTTLYLAAAPKSNASTVALGRATEDVKNQPFSGVPKPLRDSHYKGQRRSGMVRTTATRTIFPAASLPSSTSPTACRPAASPTTSRPKTASRQRSRPVWDASGEWFRKKAKFQRVRDAHFSRFRRMEMFVLHRPESTDDRELLSLIEEVRALKQDGHTYVKILRSLYARGIDDERCRDVFSRAFIVDLFRTKVISCWHPDIVGNGYMKTTNKLPFTSKRISVA